MKLYEIATGAIAAGAKLVGTEAGPADKRYDIDEIATYINASARVIKTQRTSTNVIAPGNSNLITVTWDTPFLDGDYTATVSLLDSTAATRSAYIVHMETFTLDHITVRVQNDAATSITATIHAIAVHN